MIEKENSRIEDIKWNDNILKAASSLSKVGKTRQKNTYENYPIDSCFFFTSIHLLCKETSRKKIKTYKLDPLLMIQNITQRVKIRRNKCIYFTINEALVKPKIRC